MPHPSQDGQHPSVHKIETCHTVDVRTNQIASVYCWGDRTVIVAGDRLIAFAPKS